METLIFFIFIFSFIGLWILRKFIVWFLKIDEIIKRLDWILKNQK